MTDGHGSSAAAITPEQAEVCARFGAEPDVPHPSLKCGVARQTRGKLPLNALRHPNEHGTCGWYLWWGDALTTDPEFFQPLHVSHLVGHCPEFLPYLALPPGWRVQLAPGHEDVWHDPELLHPPE